MASLWSVWRTGCPSLTDKQLCIHTYIPSLVPSCVYFLLSDCKMRIAKTEVYVDWADFSIRAGCSWLCMVEFCISLGMKIPQLTGSCPSVWSLTQLWYYSEYSINVRCLCSCFLLPLSQSPSTSKCPNLSSPHLPTAAEDSNKISLSLYPSFPKTEQVLFSQPISVHHIYVPLIISPVETSWDLKLNLGLAPTWSFCPGSYQLGYGLHWSSQKQRDRVLEHKRNTAIKDQHKTSDTKTTGCA